MRIAGLLVLVLLAALSGWWLRGSERARAEARARAPAEAPDFLTLNPNFGREPGGGPSAPKPTVWTEPSAPAVSNPLPPAAPSEPPRLVGSDSTWTMPAPKTWEQVPDDLQNYFADGLSAANVVDAYEGCRKGAPNATPAAINDYCTCAAGVLAANVGPNRVIERHHLLRKEQMAACNAPATPTAGRSDVRGLPAVRPHLDRARRTIEQVRACEQRFAGDLRSTLARRAYCGCYVDAQASHSKRASVSLEEVQFCELVAAHERPLTTSQVLAGKAHVGLAHRPDSP